MKPRALAIALSLAFLSAGTVLAGNPTDRRPSGPGTPGGDPPSAGSPTVISGRKPTDPALPNAGGAVDDSFFDELVAFRLFLFHVANLEDTAQAREDAGNLKQAAAWRRVGQDETGLSQEEMLAVTQIAESTKRALAQLNEERAKRLVGDAAGGANGMFVYDGDPKRLAARRDDMLRFARAEDAVLEAQLLELRRVLGEDAFEQIERHLRREFRMRVITPPGASKGVPPEK